MERVHEIPPKRRGMWIWIAAAVVVAAGVFGAILFWPDAAETPVLTATPPYGLTEIDGPKSTDEIISVLERMPAIDGRQPTYTREGMLAVVAYDGTAAGPHGSILVFLDVEREPEGIIEGLQQLEEEATVEASALDPTSDLLWVASTQAEGMPFRISWAEPFASDAMFSVAAETAEFRVALMHAFIPAAGAGA
jgi:hypothetical protein